MSLKDDPSAVNKLKPNLYATVLKDSSPNRLILSRAMKQLWRHKDWIAWNNTPFTFVRVLFPDDWSEALAVIVNFPELESLQIHDFLAMPEYQVEFVS